MSIIRIKRGKGCRPTANFLRELLLERDFAVVSNASETYDATVCWGAPSTTSRKTLNASATLVDKRDALVKFQAEHILAPVPFHMDCYTDEMTLFPILARKRTHRGGTDIVLCNNRNDAERCLRRGWDYYVQKFDFRDEYRVWTYRGKTLAMYKKVLAYPEQWDGLRRNHDFGWRFEYMPPETHLKSCAEIACRATNCLTLDFGAVDIGMLANNHPVVLEVNSAPGVSATTSVGLRKLANRIKTWVENRCPAYDYGG